MSLPTIADVIPRYLGFHIVSFLVRYLLFALSVTVFLRIITIHPRRWNNMWTVRITVVDTKNHGQINHLTSSQIKEVLEYVLKIVGILLKIILARLILLSISSHISTSRRKYNHSGTKQHKIKKSTKQFFLGSSDNSAVACKWYRSWSFSREDTLVYY